MARIAEPEKIDRIRYSVMEMIAEFGYEGMSIAKISERSGVSVGYLYRYYKGKDDMILDLLDSHLRAIKEKLLPADFGKYSSLYDLWFDIVKGLFKMANQDRVLARFLTKIVSDTSIPEKEKQMRKREMEYVLDSLYNLGRITGEIAQDITCHDLELVVTTIPFMYIARELDAARKRIFTEEDAKKVTRLCMNAMK